MAQSAVRRLSWSEVEARCAEVASALRREYPFPSYLYGVPRGGIAPAAIVAGLLDAGMADTPEAADVVIDDLVESGRTAKRYEGRRFRALYAKSWAPVEYAVGAARLVGDPWLVFPWEADETPAADGVVRLTQHLGLEDDLGGQAERLVALWAKATAGTRSDPPALNPLAATTATSTAGGTALGLCARHLCVTRAQVGLTLVGAPVDRQQVEALAVWAAARPFLSWEHDAAAAAAGASAGWDAELRLVPEVPCPAC